MPALLMSSTASPAYSFQPVLVAATSPTSTFRQRRRSSQSSQSSQSTQSSQSSHASRTSRGSRDSSRLTPGSMGASLGSRLSAWKGKLSRPTSPLPLPSPAAPAAPASRRPQNSSSPFGVSSPPTRRPANMNDPPPAYTETPTAASGPTIPAPAGGASGGAQQQQQQQQQQARAPSPSPSLFSISTPEDPYAFLSTFDTVFVIDDSSSMRGRSWEEVRACLAAVAPVCAAHDDDGLDVYFLNHRSSGAGAPAGKAPGGYRNLGSAAAVDRLFASVQPRGFTPTGTRLHQVLRAYVRRYEEAVRAGGGDPDVDPAVLKPINVIVVTDGVPSDDPQSVLAAVARRLDRLDAPPHQVGVQFFQVGREPGAAEALRELDDGLAGEHGVRDMVDTVTFNAAAAPGPGAPPALTADAVLKTVLGAVHKKHDRRRLSQEGPARPEGAARGRLLSP